MKKMNTILLLAASFSLGTEAKTMDVGFTEYDRSPYFMKPTASSPARGIYVDVLSEISKRTGIEFNYRFLPQKRIRVYMKLGLLDVEPGIDPSWRTEDGEAKASIYSDVIFNSEEALVYNPTRFDLPPSAADLMKHEPCKVLGFNDLDTDATNIDYHALTSEEQVLELISLDRCYWAIFPIDVFNSMNGKYRLTHTAPVATYNLALRLNMKNADYMDEINDAIRDIKASGKLSAIMNHYIGD